MPDPRESSHELFEAAAAVADRTPVEWDAVAAQTPEDARALARLRELAVFEAAMARVRDASPADALFAWGPLQALERIGEGSFAEVYRAWDPALQREVALKLRRVESAPAVFGASRWLEEARRLARVRHPNVVAVLGADEHDGRSGIWTELVHGVTLEHWLATHGALGEREAAGVGLDLCHALAAVHAAGLLHGDITTRNVMREGRAGSPERSGRIVLMDFGSAQDARFGDLAAFGTPVFTAPEVLAGESPDVRSEIYSLGVVLYRLLTARYPIEPGPLERMRERLERGDRVALRDARPELSGPLVDVVERACSPDRGRRFASMAEFEAALAAASAFQDSMRSSPKRRRGAPWLIAAVLGAALAAWFVPRLTPRRDPVVERPMAVDPAPAPPSRSAPAPKSPPPAAVAPRAVAPDIDATLLRVTAGAREVLHTGDLIAPGDELAMEVSTREALHVYVLSEDEAGRVFVLFPLANRGARNPIAPGVRQRLPGLEQGDELSWQVTSAGGRETFLTLASRSPLPPVVEAVAAIPEASPGAPVASQVLSPAALSRLRGVGGLVREPPLPSTARASMLAALARDLAASPKAHGLWMRLLVLENPSP